MWLIPFHLHKYFSLEQVQLSERQVMMKLFVINFWSDQHYFQVNVILFVYGFVFRIVLWFYDDFPEHIVGVLKSLEWQLELTSRKSYLAEQERSFGNLRVLNMGCAFFYLSYDLLTILKIVAIQIKLSYLIF